MLSGLVFMMGICIFIDFAAFMNKMEVQEGVSDEKNL